MAELKDKELEQVDGGIWYKPAPTEASADGLAPDIIIFDDATNDSMPFPRGSIDTATPKGWE